MPRIGIMSDIHGNQEALEAVLRSLDSDGAEYVVHLGDLVGYNANPRECVRILQSNGIISILGNHDLAALNPQMAESFNVLAHKALSYVMDQLQAPHFRFLQNLPRTEVLWDRYLLCHGSPENIEAYIVNLFQAKRTFNLIRKCYVGIRVCFFGHTHVQKLWSLNRLGKVSALSLSSSPVQLDQEMIHLINPGSVGQPRQGDSRAHYCLFDSDNETVQFKAVPYDIRKAQQKILEAKLPAYLAERLQDGI